MTQRQCCHDAVELSPPRSMDSIGPKGLQNDNDTNSSMRQKSQVSYTALRTQHEALAFQGS